MMGPVSSSREVHGVHEAGQGLLGEEHEQGDEMLRSGEDASGPVARKRAGGGCERSSRQHRDVAKITGDLLTEL